MRPGSWRQAAPDAGSVLAAGSGGAAAGVPASHPAVAQHGAPAQACRAGPQHLGPSRGVCAVAHPLRLRPRRAATFAAISPGAGPGAAHAVVLRRHHGRPRPAVLAAGLPAGGGVHGGRARRQHLRVAQCRPHRSLRQVVTLVPEDVDGHFLD